MPSFTELAAQLTALGRQAHARGWLLGSSGNLSAVISTAPLRLAITVSGIDKGRLRPEDLLEIDENGTPVRGSGRPSAETRLHLAAVRARGAGAVVHTHSLWSTLLSEAHATEHGLAIAGYEMLKGLSGVASHRHREWLPIIENSQDWGRDAASVEALLGSRPELHGFLIRGHGLYTWGSDVADAARQLEVLEFLLEVVGRMGQSRAARA